MPGLEILSFGCRLNIYESEVMRGLAERAGLDDAIIVNTCAVTSEAERQSRQAIRRAHRERPEAPIIVTGCAAQLHPEIFAAMPEVARVLGNGEKLQLESWSSADRIIVGDIMALRETASHLVDGFAHNTRGFLQLQQGCDHRCTFCVIPLARGPSRSVPLGAAVAAARHLLARGYREIVLTGVDLTAYGADLPGRLSASARPCAGCWRNCPTSSGCACLRSIRPRSTARSVAADRDRAAPHAASASVGAVRRRSDSRSA